MTYSTLQRDDARLEPGEVGKTKNSAADHGVTTCGKNIAAYLVGAVIGLAVGSGAGLLQAVLQ